LHGYRGDKRTQLALIEYPCNGVTHGVDLFCTLYCIDFGLVTRPVDHPVLLVGISNFVWY